MLRRVNWYAMAEVMKYFRGSPLWLISLFVLFAEGISAIAAIQLKGWAQGALVIFVISYATIVTLVFFLFLWLKPENFYSPSDYVETKPAEFIAALRGLPDSIEKGIASVSEDPLDKTKKFMLLSNLLKEDVKQHLVLMARSNGRLEVPDRQNFLGQKILPYEFLQRDGTLSLGTLPVDEFVRSFQGTEMMLVSADRKKILLQPAGQEFADWLISNELDAEKMNSDSGGWGQPFDAKAILDERSSKKETESP
jgi:hypothetical protein